MAAIDEGGLTEFHLADLVRHWQVSHGLTVDGKAGPETLSSIEEAGIANGDTEPGIPMLGTPEDQHDPPRTAPWPEFRSSLLPCIPRSRLEITSFLGHPGPVSKPDKKWRKANIISLRDLPGVDRWVDIHRLVEDILREGLRRVRVRSSYKITRCGGFVHRHIRRDPDRELSLHSFGESVDINPADNKARRMPRGSAPEPWSPKWMRLWPNGVDRDLVEAMESVGFTWGGVWGSRGGDFSERAFRASLIDPMHFELRDR